MTLTPMDLLIAEAIGFAFGIVGGFVVGFFVAATMGLKDLETLKEALKNRGEAEGITTKEVA